MRLNDINRKPKAAAEAAALTKHSIFHSICDLLQLFILTTIIGGPFSVYHIDVAAMPRAEAVVAINETTTPTNVTFVTTIHTTTPSEILPMPVAVLLDSNEIDNSYYADYVMSNQQQSQATSTALTATTTIATTRKTTTTNTNSTTTAATRTTTTTTTVMSASTTTTVDAAASIVIETQQHPNAKPQDLLSLSLLSLNETKSMTPLTSLSQAKSALSQQHKHTGSAIGNNVAATIATTFQQIGIAQKIAVAQQPTITAIDYSDESGGGGDGIGAGGGGSHSNHSLGATLGGNNNIGGIKASNTSNFRTSAKKVESKYNLPKPQKTDAPMLNYIFDTYSAANKHHHHDQRYGPHFEDVQRLGQLTNMTVQAGSSIHLNCRISLLQDKTVSWVRRNAQSEENALDLLTVGLHTYTGDKRYKMEFQYPNNWRLKITNVKKTDEAMYECQISTHPPRVIQINLHVNAPKVMIVDEYGDPLQEKYYEIDSTLQLSCVVRNVAMASSVVYWKHGKNVLNYDVTRGGVSVKTELMDDGANSTLFIAKINKSDSGNYTCSISDFQNFTIVVHILNGESFAELHHGSTGTLHAASGPWYSRRAAYELIFIFLLLYWQAVFIQRNFCR